MESAAISRGPIGEGAVAEDLGDDTRGCPAIPDAPNYPRAGKQSPLCSLSWLSKCGCLFCIELKGYTKAMLFYFGIDMDHILVL